MKLLELEKAENNMSDRTFYYSIQKYSSRDMVQCNSSWQSFVDIHLSDLVVAPIKVRQKVISPVKWKRLNGCQVLSNINFLDFLFIDIDDGITKDNVERLKQSLSDFTYLLHYTWSCKKSLDSIGTYRLRIIFPLSRSVYFNEWDNFWVNATSKFPLIQADPQCSNANRSFFMPGVPDQATKEGFEQLSWHYLNSGNLLDVDKIMGYKWYNKWWKKHF